MHRYFRGMTSAERVAFVKRYPFTQGNGPFLFADNRVYPFTSYTTADFREATVSADGIERPLASVLPPRLLDQLRPGIRRHPILAVGSNGSPEQLVRKYHGFDGPLVFPVLRGVIDGFASVYVAALSDYSAVPAMLAPVPRCRATLFVTLLDDEQRARMDATEGVPDHYVVERLDHAALTLGNGEILSRPEAYIGQQGALWHDGGPVALSAVPHEGAAPPQRSEAEAQDIVRTLLGCDMPLDAFMAQNIVDASVRTARREVLKSHHARPVSFTGLTD